MDSLKPYLKAVSGFVAPGVVILGTAITKASDGHEVITGSEWLTAVVACVVTGGTVFGVKNRPKHGRRDGRRD
jgi:hypothetical protein